MLKNYLKTAFRNLWRYKGFSLINISSLAVGITCCLIIGLFVWDELKYDKFIPEGENIYRMYTEDTDVNGTTSTASVAPMFATYLQSNYPEVESTTRLLMFNGKLLLEVNGISSYENKGLIADSSFFTMFPLKFLRGDPKTALEGATSVVISETLAKKYFPDADPIGKIIKIDKTDFAVKGVLAEIPEHFHLDLQYIIPMPAAGVEKERMERWTWNQFFTYVKVKPGTNVQLLQSKFQAAVKKEVHREFAADGSSYVPFFQPLKDIHLKSSEFIYDNAKRGNSVYVKGLSIIVLFVLIIACFNFINLATARSFRRAKEIGVRKVIGAHRSQLIFQFTGETILFSVIAVVLAALAAYLLLPSLNAFTGKSISFNPITDPALGAFLLATSVIIGILAGIYPALFMSGFQPIRVLKGLKPVNSGGSTIGLRQALVIVQFALSALLIICTIIVYNQMNFLQKKDLGFNKDQILYFDLPGDLAKDPETLKSELLKSTGIVSVTAGYGLPGDQLAGDGVIIPGKEGDRNQSVNLFIVDHDYIKTMGLKVLTGRDFSKEFKTDNEEAFIINETAVKEMGFGSTEQAIGQRLKWDKWEPDSINPVKKGKVIGVVKDFHYKSLHEKVSSAVLIIYPEATVKMAMKVKQEELPKTLDYIKTTWTKFSPAYPLDYKFLDENFEAMYQSEQKLSTLLWIFTMMAIFVGCLGLFGLAAFNAEQRTKEIGIRKVLGASSLDIVTMLSKNFLKPVLIASIIAFPVAWWLMKSWLEDFPYRIEITAWVFLLTAAASLLIAFLTVSFHAVKAAISNPVKSLRTE
ncbi:FtsX-like permease family protein [Flavihumibacter sp. R14]|nr:FtsX-like permease family protein [Flavihumibacter soli]